MRDLPQFKKARVQSVKPESISDGRKTIWRVNFTLDGVRHSRVFETEGLASSFADDLRGFVTGKRMTTTNDGTEAQLGRLFFEMLDLQVRTESISKSSHATYWGWFKSYFEQNHKTILLNEITNQWVLDLKTKLNMNSNGSRFHSALIILTKVKKYVADKNESAGQKIINIQANLQSFSSEIKTEEKTQSYTLTQYKQLLEYYYKCTNPVDKYKAAVFLLGINSGCRISELIVLNWGENIDFQKKTLFVNKTLITTVEGKSEGKCTKNKRNKTIELSSILLDVLNTIKAYQETELSSSKGVKDFVIQIAKSRKHGIYTTGATATTIRSWLVDVSIKAGLPYLSSHKAWRKTLATIIATSAPSHHNPYELASLIGNLLGHKPGSDTALRVYIMPARQTKSDLLKIMDNDNANEEPPKAK